MKKITLLLLVLTGYLAFGQYGMEESELLKNGKIKLTQLNYSNQYKEADYHEFKKISEIRNVKKVKGEVHSFEVYCEKNGTLRYSREFEIRGTKKDDGTYENVFGYYSERADMWAVPFAGSIYILNCSIRNAKKSKDLFILVVLGEQIEDKVELFNFYKSFYADYEGKKFVKEDPISREKKLEKNLTEERKLQLFSIEQNEIASIKVIHKFTDYFAQGKRSVKIGIEAVLDNGRNVKSQLFDGVAIESEYLYEIEGAYPNDKYADLSKGGYCLVNVSSDEKPEWSDCIKVKVKKRSTGELLCEDIINIPYNYSYTINHSGADGSRGNYGLDGANIVLDVKQIKHSETGEPLILYKITSDYSSRHPVNYIKLNPRSKLKIVYHGGDGGNGHKKGYDGGEKGSLKLNVDQNVEKYTLEHFGSDGNNGSADFAGEISSNNSNNNSSSTSTSSEITIKNNTGKSVCIAHYGGSTVINNGSSESFSCRDLYYGVMDGANCTGTKGALIANKSQCGQTISLD